MTWHIHKWAISRHFHDVLDAHVVFAEFRYCVVILAGKNGGKILAGKWRVEPRKYKAIHTSDLNIRTGLNHAWSCINFHCIKSGVLVVGPDVFQRSGPLLVRHASAPSPQDFAVLLPCDLGIGTSTRHFGRECDRRALLYLLVLEFLDEGGLSC